jgi:hypothetical protein
MTSLHYLALTDDDLCEGAEGLPLSQIRLAHVALGVLRVNAHIIELYRPDGKVCLKNSYQEMDVYRVTR